MVAENVEIKKIMTCISKALSMNDLAKAQKKYEAYILRNPIDKDTDMLIRDLAKRRRMELQPMAKVTSFGHLMRLRRKGKCSLDELSKKTGIAEQVISKIEREVDGYTPRWEKVEKIIDILGISLSEAEEAMRSNRKWYCMFYEELHKGEDYVSICELVRYYREKNNITITEMSLRTGILQPNLSVLEQGKRVLTYANLIKMLNAMNIPEEQFFRQLHIENEKRKEFRAEMNTYN